MKYSYSPSFSVMDPILVAMGAVAIYYGATTPFSLGIRRVSLLDPPYSGYLLIAIGVMFLLGGIYNLIQWMTSRGGGEIELFEGSMKFPEFGMTGSKQKSMNYSDVTELYIKDGDEFSVIAHTEHDRFEFDSTLFSGESEYESFVSEMTSRCDPSN